MSLKYTGSCHCGKIAFEVEGDLQQVLECNCSHCSRKGFLLWAVPRSQFKLLSSEDLSTYKFNTHTIEHKFCAKCGTQPFAMGKDPAGKELTVVNVRCLADVDLTPLERIPFDGRSL